MFLPVLLLRFSCAVLLLQLLSLGSFWACSLGRHPHKRNMDIFVPTITFHIPIPLSSGQKATFYQCQVSFLTEEELEEGQDLFAGLTVPLVVLCAARHAVGQLGMCAVLLCPREGDLQPQDLPSPHLWTRGTAGRCPGLLLPQMCGPWWWVLSGSTDLSSEPPFSPKSGKLFCSCSALLGRLWSQECLLMPFLSCCHSYIFNGFTHGPRGGDRL